MVVKVPSNQAAGSDCVPNEVIKSAGPGAQRSRVLQTGLPGGWKSGTMTAKQARRPISKDNARGILLTSVVCTICEKYLRAKALPPIKNESLSEQLASFPRMTMEFGNHYVYHCVRHYKLEGIAAAVLFLEMTAAFYRTLPKLILGELLTCDGRQERVRKPTLRSIFQTFSVYIMQRLKPQA